MPIPYNISQNPVPVGISGTPTGATQRQSYSWSPTVTGGFGVRIFSMTGTLPERMTFNPFTGTIAGIPRHVISVSGLSITVTDASGSATLSNLTIPVASAISNLMITGTPAAAIVGSAYTFTPTVSGGSGPRAYSFSGRLEDGLRFNPADGSISGTPTEDGGSFFIITVQDSVDTATLSGTIVASYPSTGGGVVAISASDADLAFAASKFPSAPAALWSSFSYDASKQNQIGSVTSSFSAVDFFLPVKPTVSDATYDVFYTARNSGTNANNALTEATAKATFGPGTANNTLGLASTKALILWEVQQSPTAYRGNNGFVGVTIPSVPLLALLNKYPQYKKRLHASVTTDLVAWTYTTTAQANVFYHATGTRPSNMSSTVTIAAPSNAGAYPTAETAISNPMLTEVAFNSDLSILQPGQWMHGTGANGAGVYVRGFNNEDYTIAANQGTLWQGTGTTTNGFTISRAGGVDFTVIIDGFEFLGGMHGARFELTSDTTGIRPKLILRNCWFGAGDGAGNALTVIGGWDVYIENCAGASAGSDLANFHDLSTASPTVNNSPRIFLLNSSPRDANFAAKAGTGTSPNGFAVHDLCFPVACNSVMPTSAQVNFAGELTAPAATPAVILGCQFGNNTASFSALSGFTDIYVRASKFFGPNTIGGGAATKAHVRNMVIGTDVALGASAIAAGATIDAF